MRKLIIVVFVLSITLGRFIPASQLASKEVTSTESSIRLVITVDDIPILQGMTHIEPFPGADSSNFPDQVVNINRLMLDSFIKHNVVGAYGFANMSFFEGVLKPKQDEIMNAWINAEQGLANHGYEHLPYNEITFEQFKFNVVENMKRIEEDTYIHKFSPKFLRFPHLQEGNTMERRMSAKKLLELVSIKVAQVTAGYSDFRYEPTFQRCLIKDDQLAIEWLKENYLYRGLTDLISHHNYINEHFCENPPQILMLHIGPFSALMTDPLLQNYRDYGVEFVSGEQAFSNPQLIYNRIDPQQVFDSGKPFTEQLKLAVQNGVLQSKRGMCNYKPYPEPSRGERLEELTRLLDLEEQKTKEILKELCL